MSPQTAHFAGSFFTDQPIPLNRQVRLLVQGGKIGAGVSDARPSAIISPHAGYRFSGALAGQAFAAVQGHSYDRIVILSPSHRYAFDGLAMPSWNQMQVPNGRVNVDRLLRNDLLDRRLIRVEDAAHDNEHGIETQLPFIARYHRDAKIVPIVVGRSSVADVARVVDALAGDGTLFVISTDLSHFHTLEDAKKLDLATAKMIETAQIAKLNGTHACGWSPLTGFLASRTGSGLRSVRLGMGDSSPVTGDETRVVGYGAWALYPTDADMFGQSYRAEMLKIARAATKSFLTKKRMPTINTDSFRPPLQSTMASFVTWTHQGRLRGCIGSLSPHAPLIEDIVNNAIKAATKDPRFPALTDPKELEALHCKIAILTKPTPVSVTSRAMLEQILIPEQTGAIIEDQGKRGTFLPMVWDSLKTPKDFADGLMRKAGLPTDHWSDTVRVWTYRAESFGE
ncbi:MAG: AmmeMemoRadiSam system protein B [Planktomarina sp.]